MIIGNLAPVKVPDPVRKEKKKAKKSLMRNKLSLRHLLVTIVDCSWGNLLTLITGVYLLGLADIVYKLNFVESFAFGSLISAVDPVATLAIFQGIAINVSVIF